MIWLILNKVNFDEARQISPDERIPYIEMQSIMNLKVIKQKMAKGNEATSHMNQAWKDKMMKMANSIQMAKDLPSPRTIKSHLPLEFLPPK